MPETGSSHTLCYDRLRNYYYCSCRMWRWFPRWGDGATTAAKLHAEHVGQRLGQEMLDVVRKSVGKES